MLRRVEIAITLAIMCVGVLCACADPGTEAGSSPEVVRLAGSGSCMPLVQLLTDECGARGVEWRYLPAFHTGGAVAGVTAGNFEVGLVSRQLSDEERVAGLEYTPLASDAVAFAVHPSVTLDGLTTAQVRGIYSGEYTNWKDLGGPDLAITVLDRNEDDSSKIILRRSVFGGGLVVTPAAAVLSYQADIADGVVATPGAIGYFSYGYGASAGLPVKYLVLDGVSPDLESISDGTYPAVRPLGLVTRRDASSSIKDFLAWTASPRAAKLMEQHGFAPIR